jgi:hypothetical protein
MVPWLLECAAPVIVVHRSGSKMRANLVTTFVGVFIAVVSWVPLWIVEVRDPQAMPVGLGLFAFAASFVGGAIALVGFLRLVIHVMRTSKTPS